MNVCALIGNVVASPELRTTNSGKSVLDLRIAVSNLKDDTLFVDVVCWEKQAELCAKYLVKGNKVGVEGRLQMDSWEKDGVKHSKIRVVANRVEFLTPKPESNGHVEEVKEELESVPF